METYRPVKPDKIASTAVWIIVGLLIFSALLMSALVFLVLRMSIQQSNEVVVSNDLRELEVVLPSAALTQPMVAEPKELFVNIDHQGAYFMDGQALDIEEVEKALLRASANNPANQSVVIRADKRVQFDFVVAVMNACNKVGITDYTVTTAGQN